MCVVYIGARGSSPRGGRGRSLSAPKLTGVGSIHYNIHTQDFTQLKVAQGACYPFDKELLQVGRSVDWLVGLVFHVCIIDGLNRLPILLFSSLQASVEVDVVDPERIIVLSDDSSSSDESDSDSDGGSSDADEGVEAAERQDVENVQPKTEEEGGEGAAAARADQKALPEGRGKKKAAVKEERPPPAPLSPGRTPLQEPLCMQTLRFMASLRRVRLAFALRFGGFRGGGHAHLPYIIIVYFKSAVT